MGRAIFYCHKCSILLRDSDFQKGRAFREGDRVACAACAPEAAERATTTRTVAPRRSETTTRTPRLPTRPVPLAEERPARRGLFLLAAGGAAGVILLSAILLLVFGKEDAPPPAPAPPPAAPREAKARAELPSAPTRENAAQAEFRKAEALAPGDLPARIRAFDDVVWKHEGTKAAEEAGRRVASLRERLREEVAAAASELGGRVRPRLAREEFGPALEDLEKARPRIDAQDWRVEVDRLLREAHEGARALLAPLKAGAAEAKRGGDAAEVARIEARVRGWGMPVLHEELRKELDATAVARPAVEPPPPAPPDPLEATAEGKAYRADWEEAMGRAAVRDYEGALAELRKAAAGLREEEVRKAAARDQEDLRALQAFHSGLLGELAKLPLHRGLSVEWRGGGETRKTSGGVVQADADRVELRAGKETVFVEWSDATAASLARLSKADARTRALFCLAEGEVEAARELLGGDPGSVPARYWAAAPGLGSRIPRPPAAEVQARDLLYRAEREWRSMETRGPAVEKYRALRNDFAATATVGRLLPRILRRSEAGREYYYVPADLAAGGTLRPWKGGRLVSTGDSKGRELLENFAEFGYYALPGATYRAWVQLGGCCEEVFTVFWQATELVDVDPATRQKIAIEPGALAAAPLKHSLRNLRRNHDHRKEPKSPARWDWVEIPLPKSAGPGLKRVRILTEQAGFGVGAALVSSSRRSPPTEPELKELETARALDAPIQAADPDLIGYWTLDEGSGGEAADLSGHGRTATVSAAWTEGKLGGALEFDGKAAVVQVPDAPELRPLADFTVCFWMRKSSEPGDWVRLVGKGDSRLRTFGVWEEAGDGKRILFQQYDAGGQSMADLWSRGTVELGKWHHVAASRRGDRAAIWIDGAKDVEGPRTGTPGASAEPLTFGFAGFHARYAGLLDDIRLYRRALGDDEIRALYEAGR